MKAKNVLNPVSIAVMLVLLACFAGLYYFEMISTLVLIIGIMVSLLIGSALHIADQWEKAVVLRMGRFVGLRGPGLFIIIPIIDRVDSLIDQRVRVTEFTAEETLTKDTVPVNVDAVVYWTVWDVEKAALEVRNTVRRFLI